MKKILIEIVVFATILAGALFGIKSCNDYKDKYEQASALNADYEEVVAGKDAEMRQLQMTTNQLKNSKDSLNQKLLEALENTGIKEKKVKELVYLKQTIHDTLEVEMPDSMFIENIDTTIIYNAFTKLNIKIDAPYKIDITPDIASEKILIFSYKKEYVNTPSKVFFIRWFQKKRKVVVVDIQESNPMIKVDQTRFINTIDE